MRLSELLLAGQSSGTVLKRVLSKSELSKSVQLRVVLHFISNNLTKKIHSLVFGTALLHDISWSRC
jgi:hypothetical protein